MTEQEVKARPNYRMNVITLVTCWMATISIYAISAYWDFEIGQPYIYMSLFMSICFTGFLIFAFLRKSRKTDVN